jgi:pimeloyl-ACP methyl ester carboxylesterase
MPEHSTVRHIAAGACVALCATLASDTARAQNDSTPPPFPAPGRLVDVGGWRLHLYCTGEARPSRPTVILESGVGDFSVEWSLVQPGVARFARVCSYDRAGDGWSDLGPHPRTMHQIVYELHTLLDRAGERPPFVLVGHSYGGHLVRLYASTYPKEVAAMALLEPGVDDPVRVIDGQPPVRSSQLVTGQPIPAVQTSNPLRDGDLRGNVRAQMAAGARWLATNPNQPPRDKLPPDAQRMRAWTLGTIKHIAAGVNPVEAEELALFRAERTRSVHPYGDMPLVVVTRDLTDVGAPDSSEEKREHRADHAAMAALSSRGKLVIATRSGHHVQLDEPQLVITTIRELVEAVR